MNEQWKSIASWDGYFISNHGRVRTCRTSFGHRTRIRLMALQKHHRGYRVVWLRKGTMHKKFFVHRLVALAFIPNPDEKPVVNHIDGDRQNNHEHNLEWATISENKVHGDTRRKVEETISDMEF